MTYCSVSDAPVISAQDWYELWMESWEKSYSADPKDPLDRVADSPIQFATGYKRNIILNDEIWLTLHRYQFHQDLILTSIPSQAAGCLEFIFNLSSIAQYSEALQIKSGQHYLLGAIAPGRQRVQELARSPKLTVDIHLEPDRLLSWMGDVSREFPEDLWRSLSGEPYCSPIRDISPAMQLPLQKIINCPYQGRVKQLFLESQVLEIIALWIEQALTESANSEHPEFRLKSLSPLNLDQIERIHRAKEILMQQFQNPPTLMALAQQVGLNDCTLKRGFRQVFGTTVFGYLHHYRMERARSLLLKQQLSVTAIAHQVGYQNLCAFSTAFRKKFGVSPRALRT
ncbi:helix-turn-helix transcriptional regulator [Desertifilum sp. FACHB-1129]|uniref:HTH araC/xylS-type domain-containing protein n=1 Tax=Desertifilum tharense IPPAS B-1220 TaxID=1781255 RepID=A0A1E5QQP4_9CYAN|nr:MULTISPECIES: AraC family transcriptional regulator [Desertifilum]MDA0213462.1 AraC family transcriptional regulator [Cyanobacteria bacterium FC1]MBD2314384.1 helix-turn-helix transcriptional regulator [Desertifilum sp. FACHB-1129]MBD2323317.1 helix-turn-helix transcriptional regulator [Desertifilum sp. FACHB-866]MBD2333162.1 helix-turn-helix transcriptional regulator [Desertifilum sp. FACHB-868]OEJ76989.1 hypothetical protein BH720_02025 [Desertifilum tharense IPPAS B-1220]